MEIRDRTEESELIEITDRYAPTPAPYMLHIRERFNDNGTIDVVHRKRVYSNGEIIDENINNR